MSQLIEYVCHKRVHAQPMSSHEFAAYKDTLPAAPDEPGYHVVYKDGYESWSPKKAFEEGYEAVK